jgi:hypothetical protein
MNDKSTIPFPTHLLTCKELIEALKEIEQQEEAKTNQGSK